MMKKAVMMFVLFMLCSSIFAFAQEPQEYNQKPDQKPGELTPVCYFWCKVSRVLFGSKEVRAGRAWFDRSTLVGEAAGTAQDKSQQEKLEEAKKLSREGKYDDALKITTELCNSKYGPACSTSGAIYRERKNDPGNAIKFSKQGCELKDARGCYDSGFAYDSGTGVTKSNTEALKYYNQGCAYGLAQSCDGLESIADIVSAAGYTDQKDNEEVRKKLYEETFKGEKYDKSEEQNIKLLEALSKGKAKVPLKEGSKAKSSIDKNLKSKLESTIPASYQKLGESVKKVKSIYEIDPGLTTGQFVIEGSAGEIRLDKEANEDGVRTARRFVNNDIVERYVLIGDNLAASQKADGTVEVGDSGHYALPKNKIISVDNLEKGIEVPGEEGESSGLLQLDQGVLTGYNYEEESFERVSATETEKGKGDYYKKGVSGCNKDDGCFVATGGEITFMDAAGQTQNYLVDREYDTPFGANRELEQKELFDPQTGREDGIELGDGTRITRITTKEGKTDQGEQIYLVAGKDGTTIKAKNVNDNWVPVESPISPKLGAAQKNTELLNTKFQQAGDLTALSQNTLDAAKENEQNALSAFETARLSEVSADELKDLEEGLKIAQAARNTAENELGEAKANEEEVGKELNAAQDEVTKEEQAAKESEDKLRNTLNKDETKEALDELDIEEGLATARTVLDSIYKITSNLKSYPAISHLLFQDADFYKDWRSSMDKAFAPLLASEWFPSAICDIGENRWTDIETEPGKAVIKTVSGTYQAVASIQMERSPEASPILCHKNPDEESDELFICDSRQVCVDNNFCYADQDRDNEADSNEPLKGYFYKVTWAVSSPQDEALTPLRDENGVAVSFNIFLYPGAVPMYNLNGNIASPIQLQNGASDKDAIIKYSTNLYDQACIRWNQAPRTITVPGGEDVEDVCFPVVTSTIGQVNWERSGQSGASVTVSHGEISRNTDW